MKRLKDSMYQWRTLCGHMKDSMVTWRTPWSYAGLHGHMKDSMVTWRTSWSHEGLHGHMKDSIKGLSTQVQTVNVCRGPYTSRRDLIQSSVFIIRMKYFIYGQLAIQGPWRRSSSCRRLSTSAASIQRQGRRKWPGCSNKTFQRCLTLHSPDGSISLHSPDGCLTLHSPDGSSYHFIRQMDASRFIRQMEAHVTLFLAATFTVRQHIHCAQYARLSSYVQTNPIVSIYDWVAMRFVSCSRLQSEVWANEAINSPIKQFSCLTLSRWPQYSTIQCNCSFYRVSNEFNSKTFQALFTYCSVAIPTGVKFGRVCLSLDLNDDGDPRIPELGWIGSTVNWGRPGQNDPPIELGWSKFEPSIPTQLISAISWNMQDQLYCYRWIILFNDLNEMSERLYFFAPSDGHLSPSILRCGRDVRRSASALLASRWRQTLSTGKKLETNRNFLRSQQIFMIHIRFFINTLEQPDDGRVIATLCQAHVMTKVT